MPNVWWQTLKALNDRYFLGPAEGITWAEHVDRLNRDNGLDGSAALSTFPKRDLPPSWFIGDVPSVEPGNWVLILSLNPAEDRDAAFYARQKWTAESFWEFQVTWLENKEWWNGSFHGPLARVAMCAFGLSMHDDSELQKQFAASHIVFAELCPYASRKFALSWETTAKLYREDVGFKVEAEMVLAMLQAGKPRLVMVNGNHAVSNFELLHFGDLDWQKKVYQSESASSKKLWHMEGGLGVQPDRQTTPVFGFPFLRKPRTHNSSVELDQLGDYIRVSLNQHMDS